MHKCADLPVPLLLVIHIMDVDKLSTKFRHLNPAGYVSSKRAFLHIQLVAKSCAGLPNNLTMFQKNIFGTSLMHLLQYMW